MRHRGCRRAASSRWCDFGGSGTSITLADAGSSFDHIGETVRYPDFSGDQIDQALLNHVVAGIAEANNADPTGTAGGSGRWPGCVTSAGQAKERLSAETATVVPAELPGFNSDIRVTRNELENLIAEPLAGLLNTIEETLQRNNIPVANCPPSPRSAAAPTFRWSPSSCRSGCAPPSSPRRSPS